MAKWSWNLADVFEAVVDVVGDRQAIVSRCRCLTYRQLDERANRLAHVLVERGVGRDDHVGVALRNDSAYLEVMLAAFKVGAVPVNVNVRYTDEELRYLFDDAGLVGLVHDVDVAPAVARASAGLPRLAWTLTAGAELEDVMATVPAGRPAGPPRRDDAHYVLYTGGTTGRPKGVVWRHDDVLFAALGGGNLGGEPARDLAELTANAVASGGRVRCLPASPLTHGTAHWLALATLFDGGTVVLVADAGMDAARIWDTVEAHQVTHLVIVGDAFARPLADALCAEPDRWDLHHLLVVMSGGAVWSASVRRLLLEQLPGAVMVDGYGTSETGGHGRAAIWPGQAQRDAVVPRFQVDDDTAVLDEHLRPVAPGSGHVGRLARRGRVPLGYHNDPEATAQAFPTVDGVRWSVPGDLALLEADGRVTLLGRGASSINSGGEKIFPEEVEAVLKAHPAVFDAIVVGVPDRRWGRCVAAVVQVRDGATVDDQELGNHCRDHLAGFKAPRRIARVDRLVRRASGKPDLAWARRTLTDLT